MYIANYEKLVRNYNDLLKTYMKDMLTVHPCHVKRAIFAPDENV